ncbi:MAG: addiction module antidote protein, HigA family [Candidatus Muproteobacteria bacterium RIFCSPHIGHO2_12_FULL_60_33]|uniref:Addiction module antidote protein, HigA family n=1 Tax=Candidatus Muproteobacteria bacterium RIFCSPLOWO2_01_FULL_60_18 TaxID=1817768 RepID=A0A1F6U602_9PROT|nr:MAG: addiction module antidote protein, HigA family [Candidatus Muproteobacteria bacterium RIFCSPHIGHO2_01_60_12]OGI52787.1 MAG: addiction module antidote protein, HigA family [Candidatus Muproteobacteria bacterium RIFCSPLOWO2_01_FULL_60_18]OGI55689.1 MAG: addiction module antidote protein, HigA family [Candidatus Muproteobacteria bacterium RIFCSPHIGHO2_12_FULL_60_33]OGI58954.1 MAG: addiction module antidote protein, HigA family [Candidatus Muproteobacteria bacterium RIFCSPHIGHO2_01_FULL_61_2
MAAKQKLLKPIHPGEILLEEFMKPMDISINQLARDIVVPPGRISAIVNGKRAITADTALRLGKYFGVSPEVWMGLQADYDLRVAQRAIGAEVEKRVQRHAA